MSFSPQGLKESDTTEQLTLSLSLGGIWRLWFKHQFCDFLAVKTWACQLLYLSLSSQAAHRRYRMITSSKHCCGINRECMESWGPSAKQTGSAEEMVTVAPRRRWCYHWKLNRASAPSSDTWDDIVKISGNISLGLEKVGSCRPRQFCRSLPCGSPISILNSLSRADLLIFILHFLSCSKSLLSLLQYWFCFIF